MTIEEYCNRYNLPVNEKRILLILAANYKSNKGVDLTINVKPAKDSALYGARYDWISNNVAELASFLMSSLRMQTNAIHSQARAWERGNNEKFKTLQRPIA